MKILGIKSVFPKGLSKSILEAHPNVVPIEKPEYIKGRARNEVKTLLNPYWIAGFVQADGTFGLNYVKAARFKLGYKCQAAFRVTQHERDLVVLEKIIYTLGCGNLVRPSSGRDRYDLSVGSVKNISEIIIPFFQKYSLYGAKYLDFQSFCLGISIIEKKRASYSERFGSIKIISS